MTLRVLTRKMHLPMKAIRTINVASRVLTGKNTPPPGGHFYEDWTINMSFRKNAPPPGGHDSHPTGTIFDLAQDIIGTNLLTKFHEGRTINVASKVLTRKDAPPPGGHFSEDWTINMSFRVLTRFYHSQIGKIAPPPCGNVFQQTGTIFVLVQYIIGTNLRTKFHDDRKINVASRVLTRFDYSHIRKNAPYIINTNLLTRFHEDRTINVASSVLTRKNATPPYIIETNLLTKFHHNRTINVASRKNAPHPGGHVFQPTGTIFELIQDNIGTNLLTVLTRKNAPPPGGHTNLLIKFHEDRTINVASSVLTRQMLTPHDARRTTTKGDHKSSP
ncbi:hypothetical protein DPMN_062099 [Dreissena polymorpha]|uniref:Uncharacterized protein n=1 Tax=Dreissena polymorpha TaxID=45954 RepID=A0A9D4HHT1_DREPO|nr:hypothetical protein DPMN_062099 [Dreissena polymorpha]